MRASMRVPAARATRRTTSRRHRRAASAGGHSLLDLQTLAGNRAVVQLLQRQSALPAPPPVAAQTDRKTIRFGSKGEDVFFLQSRLNRTTEVTEHPAVDGIFGSKTLRAVREFQRAHPPLEVDGIVGPLTWAEVDRIPDESTEESSPLAKKIFERGADAFDGKRYAHAYDFFTRAWELLPRPGILFSRAQALRLLGGRREEAIALYQQYLGMEGGTRKADARLWVDELRHSGAAP